MLSKNEKKRRELAKINKIKSDIKKMFAEKGIHKIMSKSEWEQICKQNRENQTK